MRGRREVGVSEEECRAVHEDPHEWAWVHLDTSHVTSIHLPFVLNWKSQLQTEFPFSFANEYDWIVFNCKFQWQVSVQMKWSHTFVWYQILNRFIECAVLYSIGMEILAILKIWKFTSALSYGWSIANRWFESIAVHSLINFMDLWRIALKYYLSIVLCQCTYFNLLEWIKSQSDGLASTEITIHVKRIENMKLRRIEEIEMKQ